MQNYRRTDGRHFRSQETHYVPRGGRDQAPPSRCHGRRATPVPLRTDHFDYLKATQEALDDAGSQNMPIIAGTGAGSTRETIQLCKEAAEAGADYVIVIGTPGYFASVLATNRKALKAFFTEVAENSPIPVIVYNCWFTLDNYEQRCSCSIHSSRG